MGKKTKYINKQKFSIVKKGYSPGEVDEFIARLEDNFEQVLREQKTRIFELKNQLTETENKVASYDKMSGRVGEAIIEAVSKAEQIEKYNMQKLQFEIEQLKAFHARWQEYYLRIMNRYPLDDDLANVKKVNAEMTRILNTPQKSTEEIKAMFDADYQSQTTRLNEQQKAEKSVKKVAPSVKSKPAPKPPKAVETPPPTQKTKPQGNITVKAYEEPMSVEKIDQLLSKFFPLDAGQETPRSEKGGKFDPMKKIDNHYKAETNKGEETGFSLQEALRPKQSLEDILKDLGVNGDE
ncbi:MAG: DivIVA domain-containing protein [Firmicutes bacterium]|nr:DivIVA domain-containing protein [Bacillota bacterium]